MPRVWLGTRLFPDRTRGVAEAQTAWQPTLPLRGIEHAMAIYLEARKNPRRPETLKQQAYSGLTYEIAREVVLDPSNSVGGVRKLVQTRAQNRRVPTLAYVRLQFLKCQRWPGLITSWRSLYEHEHRVHLGRAAPIGDAVGARAHLIYVAP